ncbi:MAG: YlbF family regulator [Clostridia bacterium]|nr:YlbF family regulator [Clostridia bacterium]
MNSNEILEKAKELGMMIADSDEFKRLKETEDIQLSDPEAQQMMMNYNKSREALSERAAAPDLTKEEWEKIQMDAQAEFIKLCQNDKIKNYLDANQCFSDLINQVNGIIAHFVKGEDQSGCSGSCASCKGCH